jgi:hypothetical protein
MTTAKTGAPVVGFNHNVKYGPRVYHVQTEDSGLPHAHYITHLFLGGNIVSSLKTSYADKTAQPNLAGVVRSLMEGQHKFMLKRLVAGEFDEQVERLSAQHYDPGVLADGSNQASYVNAPAAARPATAKPAAPARPAARPAAPAKPPAARPAQQPVWQAAPPSASPVSPRAPGSPLPAVTRGPAQPTRPTVPPRMAPVAPSTAARPGAAKSAPSFFNDSPVEMPHDDLPTLFAEELISEKSLDEVILAFLSADLEPPK